MDADLKRMRRGLISEIRSIVKPQLRDSGYRTQIDKKGDRFDKNNSRPWKIWVPRDKHGTPTDETIRLGGIVLDEFEGLSEDGPVTEFYIGAVWIGYSSLPLEDLLKLKAWLVKRFRKS